MYIRTNPKFFVLNLFTGLLITFIELIKNRNYNFWSHEFVQCAPEIQKLFESVARSCMVHSPPRMQHDQPNPVASGSGPGGGAPQIEAGGPQQGQPQNWKLEAFIQEKTLKIWSFLSNLGEPQITIYTWKIIYKNFLHWYWSSPSQRITEVNYDKQMIIY